MGVVERSMDLNLLISLVGTGIALILVLVLFNAFKRINQQASELSQLTDQQQVIKKRIVSLDNQQEEVRSATYAMVSRIKQLESDLQQLQSEQQTIVEQDPQSRFYSKGMKLVSQGASVEEVMAECEMPQAEAELLFNLHNKQ